MACMRRCTSWLISLKWGARESPSSSKTAVSHGCQNRPFTFHAPDSDFVILTVSTAQCIDCQEDVEVAGQKIESGVQNAHMRLDAR